jgi:hypothetical protein
VGVQRSSDDAPEPAQHAFCHICGATAEERVVLRKNIPLPISARIPGTPLRVTANVKQRREVLLCAVHAAMTRVRQRRRRRIFLFLWAIGVGLCAGALFSTTVLVLAILILPVCILIGYAIGLFYEELPLAEARGRRARARLRKTPDTAARN